MAILPEKNLLDGTKDPSTTTGEFRLAMGNLRQFIADLLGDNSSDKQHARDVLGAQEKYQAEATGTPDALAATFAHPVIVPLHGMRVQIRAATANTTTAPTFKADQTSALPIVKGHDQPLQAGDIAGDGHWLELQYDNTLVKWVLLNPAFGISVMPSIEPVLAEKADRTEMLEHLTTKLDKTEKIPVGTVIAVAGNITPAGYLYCNGATLSPSAYPELFKVIGTLFGGNGLTTFSLPDFRNRWMRGADTAGSVLNAGLPNIVGEFGGKSEGGWQLIGGISGAFYTTGNRSGSNGNVGANSSGSPMCNIGFAASNSNGIYGASGTVQPPSLTVRYCIKY